MADKIVAFICTHNACRSQIAEALARPALVSADESFAREIRKEFPISFAGMRNFMYCFWNLA